MKIPLLLAALAMGCLAQEPEELALRQALAEAGNSQVDFMRALENHLARFPETPKRAELERAIVKAAAEVKDNRRLLLYGERVLSREPDNRELLERVSRLLLADEDKENNERALDYARRLQKSVVSLTGPEVGSKGAAAFAEQRARALGKALVFQSRAAGNLGKIEDAENLARQSYREYPTAEAAREIGRWLEKQDKLEEAVQRVADAFMLVDPAATGEDRRKDRERLGKLYRQWKGTEAGLGDQLLAAFDRTGKQLQELRAGWLKLDPNAEADNVMEFTLSGMNGDRLPLASLLGKVVVLDFWATWCGPCRAQQPLYEQVKERFKQNADVVFLNVSTDEDRGAVKPFLDQMKWNKTVYFEDGLSLLLRVSSIPTTLVIGRRGQIVSRMNGYVENRFVDMLTDRVRQALAEN